MKILRIILFLFLSMLVVSCTSSKPKIELANPFEEGKVENLKYAIEKVENKEKRYVIQGEEVGFFTACDDDNAKSRLKNIANKTCLDLHVSNIIAKEIVFLEYEGGSCSKIRLWFYCDITEQQKIKIKKEKEDQRVAELNELIENHNQRVSNLQEIYHNKCDFKKDDFNLDKTKEKYLSYKKCLEDQHDNSLSRLNKLSKKYETLKENRGQVPSWECNGHDRLINSLINPEFLDCAEEKFIILKKEDKILIALKEEKENEEFIISIRLKYPESQEACEKSNVSYKHRCYVGISDKEKRIGYLEKEYSCYFTYLFGDRYDDYYNCLNNQQIKANKKTKVKKKSTIVRIVENFFSGNKKIFDEDGNQLPMYVEKDIKNKILQKKPKQEVQQTNDEDLEYLKKMMENEDKKIDLLADQLAELRKQTKNQQDQKKLLEQQLKEEEIQTNIEKRRDSLKILKCTYFFFSKRGLINC